MKITLADIPVTSLEILRALAAEAPAPPVPPPAKQEQKSKTRRRRKQDLGSLLMEKYLQSYGIEYSVKEDAGKKIYVLRHCVFDPAHGNKEASIVQDATGKITYQCFHNSCKGRTWSDARALISGKDNLAQYCDGFDENLKGTRAEAATGILKDVKIGSPTPGAETLPAMLPAVPPPNEIDPLEFFHQVNRTLKFVSHRMSVYYAAWLQHLVHTASVFWKYQDGVWIQYSEHEIQKICVTALEERCQPAYLDGTVKILRAMVNREEPEWPRYPTLINCLDGMVDVNTGKLSPHDPKYGSRTRVPCHFNPQAECERWFQFLEEIFPGNPEKHDLLQKFFGYCLLSDCRFEKALFLYGEGANGKGTVLHVLRAMVGAENTSSLTMKDLGDPKFSIYFLQGKLVNVATETSARDPLATEMFKTIVSGEPVTCEMKFGHKFQFSPFVKFVIAMNEPPVIPDKTYGFERRLLVLGFNERFEGEKKDVGLKDKLIQEIDGVFIWALQGLNKLLADRDFLVGDSVRKEHSDFLKELNPIIDFFEETVDVDPDDAIEIASFYKTYQVWCRDKGVRQLALKRFNREVLRQFPTVSKDRFGKDRRSHFIGLTARVSLFKSNRNDDDEEPTPF